MNIFNQIKKSVASFTLGALLFGFVTPVANAQLGFTDDAEIPSWAFEAIDELMSQGVVSGNQDGSFAPNRQLNRAEVSKIIVLSTGVDLDVTGGPNFPDVAPDAWYYDYVETMYNNGWINGYPDGMFRPEVGINRAEIAKMVVNAFEIDPDTAGAPHFDDVTSNDWFFSYVETAYNYGLMRGYGDGTFGPADPVTRAQTVKIVYDSQLVVTGPMGTAEGTLEVTLSSDTPRGTNIPYNATSVPFTTLEMTASDDTAVELSSITFTRLGLGDNDDFDNVWLEIDGFKVGNDKSVNNDDVVELRFNPPVIIPAGQTVMADVVASMDYQLNSDGTCFGTGNDGCNIGHNNRFALVSADDVVSSAANVVGPFPIEGEEMEIANYEVTQAEFQVLGSDTTVDVGDNFIEIGKFRMLNESTTNKDIELRALTFKNDGNGELDQVLENVALYVSGEQISAETIIDGDYVTFRLDNGVTGGYILEDGDSRIFSVRADIVSAEKGDTINFKIDNFEDVVGIEIGTSFGVKAVSRTKTVLSTTAPIGTTDTSLSVDSDAEDDNARLRLYTIDTGDLNVSRDPSSLGNQQYAPGSNDVVFLTARVVVDQPLIVDGVKIRVADSTGITNLTQLNTDFDNFRLFLNDKLIDTENEFIDEDGVATSLEGDYLDFNTTFEIAGTSVLKLVGNIQDDATTGESLSLSLAATDFASPEYISTGDQVDADQLLGSAEASSVEIEVSQVTISKSDGLSTGDELVAGVDDITLMEFTLSNNDSGDINVTSVTIKGQATGAPATKLSNFTAAIFVDGIQQGSSKNLNATTGVATFNDISVVIPTSSQKEFAVVVDTIESIADSNPADTVVVAGPGVDVVAGAAITPGAETVTVAAESTVITVSAPTTVALSNGDEIVVSTTGAPTDSGAEIRIVDGDYATGVTTINVTVPFENGHSLEEVSLVTRQYTAPTTFTVASVANIEVGDILSVLAANDCTVAAVNTTTRQITCGGALGTVVLGEDVTEATSGDSFGINITAVDADNVENGQKVQVLEGGVELGVGITDPAVAATTNGNCTGVASTDNYLCGAVFNVLQSGTLFVESEDLTPVSRILVADTDQVEVLRLRLTANDDDIEIKDLYFVQQVAAITDPTGTFPLLTGLTSVTERLDFSLRDSSGALIQERNMVGGKLHFELSNSSRIRVPKDDSINISVFADVRAITTMAQTGQQLRLAIDTEEQENGFEANTVATGRDLLATAANSASNTAIDETFVIYKTAIKLDTAATQPQLVEGGVSQALPVYRFTVSADAAGDATLERFSAIITPVGVTHTPAATDLLVFRCNSTDCTNATDTAAVHSIPVAGTQRFEFAQSQNIPKGSSVTFEIRTNAAIADADPNNTTGEQFTVSFPKDVAYATPSQLERGLALTALTAQNIVWSDRSNSGNAGAFIGGYQLTVPDSSALVGASR